MGCTPAPTCRAALAEATRLWPNRRKTSDGICGDPAHQARVSDHNAGNAWDLSHDPAHGCDAHALVEQIRQRQDKRVKYIISNRRICGPGSRGGGWNWKSYTGSNPHTLHSHVSIWPSARNDTSPWFAASSVPKPAQPPSNKLSAGQIKWLAQTIAGKTGDDAVIAVAVALAESFEGDPKAYNGKGLDASYGLWQINMHGNLGPVRRRQFGLSTNEDLFNPVTNARAMREIHEEQGWDAWGAFTDGRYRKYLDVARAAVPTPYGQPASGQEDEVIRIIQTREHDGQDPKWPPPRTLDGVYVESNFSFVKWIPNGLVWSAIERHAQEGRRDQGGPVLVRRDEFDTLQKVGNAPWPEPYSGAK